jgi:hypothetical protein
LSDDASKEAKKKIAKGIEKHRVLAIRRTEAKTKRQQLENEEVEEGTPDDKGRRVASATGTAAGGGAAKKKAHGDKNAAGKKQGDTTAKAGKKKGPKNKAGEKNDAGDPDAISEDDSAEKEVSRYLATWCRFRENVHFDESTPFSEGRQKKAWISRNPIVWIT